MKSASLTLAGENPVSLQKACCFCTNVLCTIICIKTRFPLCGIQVSHRSSFISEQEFHKTLTLIKKQLPLSAVKVKHRLLLTLGQYTRKTNNWDFLSFPSIAPEKFCWRGLSCWRWGLPEEEKEGGQLAQAEMWIHLCKSSLDAIQWKIVSKEW